MTTEHTLGLTPAAEARFDDYLDQMRRALAGAPDVSPDEIEADIREHVENELRTAVRPVEPFVLEAVLRRLGPPTQWLPPGRPPAAAPFTTLGQYLKARWRAAWTAVWRGPEDWRLAYLSFGTFALGVLAFPLFPLFLVVSYVLSRAGIAAAADKGIALDGGRKWLLYPPVVLVSFALVLAVIAVPVGVIIPFVVEAEQVDYFERWDKAGRPTTNPWRNSPRLSHAAMIERYPGIETRLDRVVAFFPGSPVVRDVFAIGFFSIGVLLAWWAVVGGLAGAFPGVARGLVFPFAQDFAGARANRIGATCLVLFVLWGVFAYRIADAAGLV